ncbi:MAG: hypothetical protein LBQ54_13260 [Planctomycetaceae bacterium]|nr:hypothetical protein [Planctomycetaceae bacterium]
MVTTFHSASVDNVSNRLRCTVKRHASQRPAGVDSWLSGWATCGHCSREASAGGLPSASNGNVFPSIDSSD